MEFNTLFGSLLVWLVQFILYVPFTVLRLVSALLPPCSTFGATALPVAVSTSMVNWVRFYWPIIQYIPWVFVWNFVSAVLLYVFFKWLWSYLPRFIGLVMSFWWIFAIFYVVAWSLNTFLDDSWKDSTAFTEVFGTGATSTGSSGSGFGGGAGGSW